MGISERDISTLQSKLKESKKVTVREPPPPPRPSSPTVVTQSRLAQTDPWMPTPIVSPDKPEDSTKDLEAMMQTRIEALEQKYQTIIEQKTSQIQQLMHEVRKKTTENLCTDRFYLKIDGQQKGFKMKMEKYLTIEERHRNDMKRFDSSRNSKFEIFLLYRHAEKHKQDMQIWESKYDILKKR